MNGWRWTGRSPVRIENRTDFGFTAELEAAGVLPLPPECPFI